MKKMTKSDSSGCRFGMVVDLDRCNGCGACMVACAVENNVPPARPEMDERNGITWMKVFKIDNEEDYPNNRSAFVPMMCQQCEDAPCISVCPQNAVAIDPRTGIVAQIPERCLGCRYCMTACPYHARYFNWWDPQWPGGMEKTLNPDVSPRMRGVVEKCNLCHGRLHAAKEKAAAQGNLEIDPTDYVPACVEACPTGALTFGDFSDENSEVSQSLVDNNTFRFLESLGTESKVYYRSQQPWIRQLAEKRMRRLRQGKREV